MLTGTDTSGRIGGLVARSGYLIIILLATLHGIEIGGGTAAVGERLEDALRPGWSGRDAVDAVRNLLLFGGWGAVWVLTAPRGEGWQAALQATALGLLLSVFVETIQLLSPLRTTSILDVLTNGGGAAGGAVLMIVLARTVEAGHRKGTFLGIPAFLIAGSYAGVVLLESFAPRFRQERIPGNWGGPLDRLDTALSNIAPGSLFDVPMIEFFFFAPAGALAVIALVEFGHRRRGAFWWTAGVGSLLVLAAEIAHGAVGQPIFLGAIAAHAAGIVAGAAAAMFGLMGMPATTARLRPDHAWTATLALVVLTAYTGLLLLWDLRPFTLDLDIERLGSEITLERFIPLRAQGQRVDLYTVADIGVQFLLYLPLGALLAVWPLRLRGWLAGLAPVIYLAVLVEILQIFVGGRYFDITDILVRIAGAGAGWVLVRRAGYLFRGSLLGRSSRRPSAPGRGS